MFDPPCLSPCCEGEIRQVLAGILGLVKPLGDSARIWHHGTPSQMPNVASSTKAAQQAWGKWDYNASLACHCPKLSTALSNSWKKFPVGPYLDEVLHLLVVVNFKAAVPQDRVKTKI